LILRKEFWGSAKISRHLEQAGKATETIISGLNRTSHCNWNDAAGRGVLPYCWVLILFLNSGRITLSPAAFAIPKPYAFGDCARDEIRTWLQNFTAFS
jgi:hypothetical protein